MKSLLSYLIDRFPLSLLREYPSGAIVYVTPVPETEVAQAVREYIREVLRPLLRTKRALGHVVRAVVGHVARVTKFSRDQTAVVIRPVAVTRQLVLDVLNDLYYELDESDRRSDLDLAYAIQAELIEEGLL